MIADETIVDEEAGDAIEISLPLEAEPAEEEAASVASEDLVREIEQEEIAEEASAKEEQLADALTSPTKEKEEEVPVVEIQQEARDDEPQVEAQLSHEHKEEEEASPAPEPNEMPPAPFVNPTSPSLGDEAGMEAMWVEELVTPSPTGQEETEPQKQPSRSKFFHKRMGPGLFKRHHGKESKDSKTPVVEPPPRRKKVQTSVKLLGDEEEPQLELPSASSNGRVRAPGPNVRVQVQTGTRRPPSASTRSKSGKLSVSKQIARKATNARELLAMALHSETDDSKKQGLAQAAFAEATEARLRMEGDNPPKGLDLVLRAASHKGRSAALAASMSSGNTEQVSRAKHYMDLILPRKTFPVVSTDHVAPVKGDSARVAESLGEMSSLGFCTPRQVAPTASASKERSSSPISMSSLNEILDGPMDEEKEAAPKERAGGHSKARFAFLRNFSPNSKREMSQETALDGVSYEEMPPPDDAPSMDENGSWTDISLDDGVEQTPSTVPAQSKGRKTKRVFRLARITGRRSGAASSNGSTRSDRPGWLRRKSQASVNTQLVDHVPTPPPNVPYQSKPYQRYIANVQIDTGSRRSASNTIELSTVVKRTVDVEAETQERIHSAIMADETEHITSFDGVRMFGQNADSDDELEDPPEEISDPYLPKRSVKVDPHFVQAPAGHASILTAKSWDSLVEDGAARLADAPQAIVQALLDSTDVDEEIPLPVSSPYYAGPPGYTHSASPHSVDSRIPGLMDKYSSAEEPGLDDKYSMQEVDERTNVSSPSSESRSGSMHEIQGEESPRRRRLGGGLLARINPRRKSQEKEQDSNEENGEDGLVEECVDDNEEEVVAETPKSTEDDGKPRRKMNLFKKFQLRKKSRDDAEEDEEQEDFPVEEIEYKEVLYGDIGLQQTGTTTLTDVSDAEDFEPQNEKMLPDEMELPAVKSEDTADSLIRNIRTQAGRSRRGMDPVSRNAVEMPRGIDP